MFAYQKNHRFFAQVADGLEELGCKELAQLGAEDVRSSYRGIYFSADHASLYRINYTTRLCTRILAPLLTFDCHSDRYLYKTARKIEWGEVLSLDTTFAIFANVANSNIRHSQFAARRLKDAIVDQFRDASGKRPDVEPMFPDIWINLFIQNNKATISLDTSGGSLHRRGYRLESVEAPMQETVAAAIIHMSGWQGERPLYDPMCGSGTLLAEAFMSYRRIPAGYLRKDFGFEHLPDFDAVIWKEVKKECDDQMQHMPPGLVGGSDKSKQAVEAARKNCRVLPDGNRVRIEMRRFQEIGSLRDSVIVCNPPYGERMTTSKQAAALLNEFGKFLKERCQGSVAFIYLGKDTLLKQVPLNPSWKKPLNNGGLQGYLIKYDIR